MAHNHSHHSHAHHHGSPNYNRAFVISVVLNVAFVIIEAVYGIAANSLALLADAGHNLSDVLGLLLAWGASVLAQRRPSARRTFGLRRSSILAALVNAVFLFVVSGGVGWEAIRRFREPDSVAGGTIITVAAIGIVINTMSALMFLSGRRRDLNLRGAFLHMAADAVVSLGVVLAGIAIVLTGQQWFDPAVSLIVTIVIIAGTWGLFRDALNLITDAVPNGIESLAVRTYLAECPGVSDVHDLHIWAMSTTETALMAHIVMPDGHPGDAFLAKIYHDLHDYFGIEHATIQIEMGNSAYPCALACENVV
jgi:cobalt-zinc-cadmium efflux system protein